MNVHSGKCPNCGSLMNLNLSDNELLACTNCLSKFSLSDIQSINDIGVENSNVSGLSEDRIDGVTVYCCCDCKAQFISNTKEMVFCAYCGSTNVLNEREFNGRYPDYIIPFKITKEEANKCFLKLVRRNLLMPKSFKLLRNIDKISGLYVPLYVFDLIANGNVDFEAFDIKKWNNLEYKYKQIERYLIKKNGYFEFSNVLISGDIKFPNSLIGSLAPFDYNELVLYDSRFLSGFYMEKECDGANSKINNFLSLVNSAAVDLMKNEINYKEKKVVNNEIKIISNSMRYIMIPVWVINIKYKDKIYIYAVNGQSGKVIGKVPIGLKEVFFWSLVFFCLLFIVGLIIRLLVF